MKLQVQAPSRAYPIYIERGSLKEAAARIPSHPKYVIITDDGVPNRYKETLKNQLPNASLIEIPQGEASKSLSQYGKLLEQMANLNLTRKDAVIALGGGVVGDLAGFCAASYMRGIAFVNIPTTLLAQVDSSVGGKTAVDLGHLKNIVGAFWQPETVIIDPDVLITLPEEQLKAGLAEALKMGLIFDEALVEAFEAEDLDLDYIITRSIDLKRQIVEQDEREAGCRALLNFGHTIGHAIEAATGTLHGLCVAAGMLYFIEDEPLKNRVKTIYERLGIEPEIKADKDVLMDCLLHDKKSQGKTIQTVHVKEAGKGYLQSMTPADIEKRLA